MTKTLLVTGASKGIGYETVLRFLEHRPEYTKIIMLARSSTTFTEHRAQLAATAPAGVEIISYEIDLADRDAIIDLVRLIHAEHGNIEFLLNNAGYTKPVSIQQVDFADFERTMAVNVYAPFTLVQELLRCGNKFELIINIASTRAWQSEANSEAYAAAKGGLVAFTHALAISAGPKVRVNSISPGWIATDAWQAPSRRRTPKLSRRDHAQHAVGRVGQPEDIGALAVFLLSDLAGFITGQDHIVDGGMSRTMIYAD